MSRAREELDIIGDRSAGLNFQWSVIEGLNGEPYPPVPGRQQTPVLDYDQFLGDGYAIIVVSLPRQRVRGDWRKVHLGD